MKKSTLTIKFLWLREQIFKIRQVVSEDEFSNERLLEYLLEKWESKKNPIGRLYNNTDCSNQIMTLEQFINLFLNSTFILSGYNTLYKNQDEEINIGALALENLLNMRKFYKNKMEASEWGSADYIYYKILQMTYKVLANSYYGILGEKNSIFYNPFIQNSITMTGQDIITTSIVAMEGFLANNNKFTDTDDAITFISNVKQEKRTFNILEYLDHKPSYDETFEYLSHHCEKPDSINLELLSMYLKGLSDEEMARVYYKNRLQDLIFDNSYFLEKLKTFAFEEGSNNTEEFYMFRDMVVEICYYDHLYEDRYRRALKNNRRAVIVVDTDSNFININDYMVRASECFGIANGDPNQLNIMNAFIDVVTKVLEKTFWTFTSNMNLIDRCKPIINMKSEFIYRRILLTENKKNYSGIIIAELGKLLKQPQMDTKGLAAIKKTNVPKKLRREFAEILRGDILEAEKIDLVKILGKYDKLSDNIKTSLAERNTEYLLPKNAEIIETYAAPDQIEPIRGIIAWNALEPESQIVLPEKVNLLKLKELPKDAPEFMELKNKYPDKYNALMKAVYNEGIAAPKLDISRFGFSSVAIPKSVEKIPEYLIPFIDYLAMTNNNMSNGYIILKSLGIYIAQVEKFQYKSNIVKL